MQSIVGIAALGVLFVAAIAAWALWPALFSFNFRKLLRNWPEGRSVFTAGGAWIGFSKRFGLGYVAALLVFPFVWMAIFIKLTPDTTAGVYFLFGPGIVSIGLGCVLGALRVARWMVDDG